MSKVFLILSLFAYIITNSQVHNGKIIYCLKVNPDSKVINSSSMGSTYSDMSKIAATFSFLLQFNGTKASFQRINNLTVKESETDAMISDLASIMYATQSNYYLDFKENYTISEISGVLIKDTLRPLKWVIASDIKIISDILCYKASSQMEYVGRDNKIKVKNIIAWFAPSLPYSFGPKIFYGLPGLILELTENRTTYLATIVDFSDEIIKIDFPKGKIISEEQYSKKVLSN